MYEELVFLERRTLFYGSRPVKVSFGSKYLSIKLCKFRLNKF